MAKKSQNSTSFGTKRFDKEMNQDIQNYHLPENAWNRARNAINNSKSGDLGGIGNEPSNELCIEIEGTNNNPLTIIGTIHLIADYFAIFSTDNTESEIGIFQESVCSYYRVVNDDCLNFSTYNLIKGVSREKSTCDFSIYWDDGENPTRVLEVTIDPVEDNAYTNPNSPVAWIQDCQTVNDCEICENKDELDCDAIRLAPFIQVPCIEVKKGFGSGTLLNGSYQVALAYAVDGQKVSDWYISNVQPIFEHQNAAGSIDVFLSNVDQDFDEIQVVIISVTNQQTAARYAGIYNTRQQQLSFDTIDNSWEAVPIEEIPLMTPVVDKTDDMYAVNDYLIRVGPTSKQDFNYQPLANQIITKWQSVEYPADYYRKGGNKTNYLRDEVYAFFIRWVYDTGDRSSSYHIPGRPALASDLGNNVLNSLPTIDGGTPFLWLTENTAGLTGTPNATLDDGGVIVGQGYMGYWESSELYPDDKPEVWNAGLAASPWNSVNGMSGIAASAHDLCGKNIRHHKMPDLNTHSSLIYYNPVNDKIRILATAFENIQHPVDNNGDPIQGIVGYEILRGTRNGNKTILAKGLINNMGSYELEDYSGNREFLYPNYPYNDLREDPFLSTTETAYGVCGIAGILPGGNSGNAELNYNPLGNFKRDVFTFHSPDTNFINPFLSANELKIHAEFYGGVTGKFELSEEHPKEKLLTNLAFIISAIAGVGIASLAMVPERRTEYVPPVNPGYGFSPIVGASNSLGDIPSGFTAGGGVIPLVIAAQAAFDNTLGSPLAILAGGIGGLDLQQTGLNLLSTSPTGGYPLFNASGIVTSSSTNYDIGESDYNRIALPLRVAQSIPIFMTYFARGTDSILEFIKAIAKFQDFALRYHSHCYYNGCTPRDSLSPTNALKTRYLIEDAQYIGPQLTDFGLDYRINNLYRANTVAVKTNQTIVDPSLSGIVEATRIRVTQVDSLLEPYNALSAAADTVKRPDKHAFDENSTYVGIPNNVNPQRAVSYYVSLKQNIENQYGKINGVQQFPISCVFEAPRDPNIPTSTGEYTPEKQTVFGGDTYLGRYTEKNTFFYFYDWLYGQPDGAQFDYTKKYMFPYPRFWGNFEEFETGDFISSLGSIIGNLSTINPFSPSFNIASIFSGVILPNDYYNLDGLTCFGWGSGSGFQFPTLKFAIKYAWFYLFNSGVRDFWVESEINVDLRDWGELETQQHYDPYRYTDTKELFHTKNIKVGNYYKYDFSLSLAKLWNHYISWGNVQLGSYDPYLAETCYVYRPKRVIYSLRAQFENLRDNWAIYLANNYKDFLSRVTAIKSVSKSGALMFFENESPVLFRGLDQLQTTSGTKLTIGDGGLFEQPLENIVNTDKPYEYGSCQNRLSVINTVFGTFWISQNQGKIFNYAGKIDELSMRNVKWWLALYLPYKLTEEFPDFELTDNPIVGIGCQTIYDNENAILYFTKRDYIVKRDLPIGVTLRYDGLDDFTVMLAGIPQFPIKLGDERYFEDASWTFSYDPKQKSWLSHHDWHPNLLIPGKNTFMSIINNSIWIHNERCDSYCNFYGVDYPFEIEFTHKTAQMVNTLRNIEYIMEAYVYDENCYDRFHILDYNFDEAVIYNTEQCSGLLRLNLEPKNDPQAILDYPIIGFNFMEILYSKEENKYRFNQFWDITDDRGEFNTIAQRMIWNTEPNGYVRVLNDNNLDYNKDEFERKKFRHYTVTVFLRKNVSGNTKIIMLFGNTKNLMSPR